MVKSLSRIVGHQAYHPALHRDTGYEKPTLFNPIGKAQTPSNVTRLSRSLRRVSRDGTLQIIAYQNGVGTGSTMADAITGGAFGRGIAEVSQRSPPLPCALSVAPNKSRTSEKHTPSYAPTITTGTILSWWASREAPSLPDR